MRVLIAGGTGLIGTALVKSLRDNGYEVIILTRAPEQAGERAVSGVRLEMWDGRSTAGWGPLVEEVDAIVNLAGEGIADGRWTAARKRRIRDSRVDSGKALVAAVADASARPAVLIQSSAVGLGSFDRGSGRDGGPAAGHSNRRRLEQRRRCVPADDASVSIVRRRAAGKRQPILPLDSHR